MTRFLTRLAMISTTGVAAAAFLSPVAGAAAATPAGTAPVIPTAHKSVPRFSPLYMGYQDKTPLTSAIADRLAANYDVIAATPTELKPFIAEMKAINPKLVIVGYVNGMYANASSSYPENWFSHDSAGDRIYTYLFGGDLMDPSNAGWKASVVNSCTTQIAGNGYDGCFIDNLGQAPFLNNYVTGQPMDTSTGAEWTHNDWTAASTSVAQAVVDGAPGAVVLGNGLGSGPRYFDPAGPTSPLLNSTSAALSEVFLRTSNEKVTDFPSETQWKSNVDMLADAEAHGHSVLTTTKVWLSAAQATAAQVEVWHRYALASFLLGSSGGSFYSFSGAQSTAAMSSADPEDAIDIGTPLGAYTNTNGLYQRTYTGGIAMVNPTKVAATVPLAGSYTRLDGTSAGSSITLPPNTGEVLKATAASPDAPSTVTASAASSGAGAVTLTGAVNPTGAATNYTFRYGPTSSYSSNTTPGNLTAGYGQSPVAATISGLTPGTTYHYHLDATNSNGTAAPSDSTFTTAPLAPAITNSAAGNTGATTSDITASINPGNGTTTWAVQYGTTMKYGSTTGSQVLAAGSTPTAVTATITGLKPVTAYHTRIAATNSAGTTYSADRTIKTLPLAPTTTTPAASGATPTGVTLTASVNPGGGRTTFTVQYGTTTGYGTTSGTGTAGSGTTATAARATLAHLLGSTTYHARLVATNAGGTTTSPDMTFATAAIAPALTSPTTGNITANAARVTANLNNEGQTTTYAVQYGTTTSYGSTSSSGTLSATSSPRSITVGISHLAPHTTYHYEVTATNSTGTTTTADRTFTTIG